ncbi:hypothetical protein [Nonomuraea rubra]|uniref:hypothetical protein n=1 Tax=Nonomuraea rubra TaxID=46180 RepID=UPI0031ECCE52
MLCRGNVQQQLENLRTYRKVDEQVRAGKLELVGAVLRHRLGQGAHGAAAASYAPP